MKFEQRDINTAEGWVLAHSIAAGHHKIPKGTLVTKDTIDLLRAHDVTQIQVFQLGTNDLDEDTAAMAAANQIGGSGIEIVPAGRGRTNLIASVDGLFLPADCIDALNRIDDAFSAASLPGYKKVKQGQLVATIKLVPYGVDAGLLEQINRIPDTVSVRPFTGMRAALVSTAGPVTDKTRDILQRRLRPLDISLTNEVVTNHTERDLSNELLRLNQCDNDIILILGASAISDARDIVPSALVAAGGTITKLGMPTDPGNLLMLGTLSGTIIIGLPGCARSPALNGLDLILERLAVGLPVDHTTITMMGTGGLLKEIPDRKTPRLKPQHGAAGSHVTAIILAAGRASRAQGISKLLSTIEDKSVIETTMNAIKGTDVSSCRVITGHKADAVASKLSGYGAEIVHNDQYTCGMGRSLACGIASIQPETRYALVCLGDMPFIRTGTYQKLIDVARKTAEPAIIIPTFHGKRGHPVLWHAQYFDELKTLDGDTGGKHFIEKYSAYVMEVPVDDAGILIDLDTPEMLQQFGVSAVSQ